MCRYKNEVTETTDFLQVDATRRHNALQKRLARKRASAESAVAAKVEMEAQGEITALEKAFEKTKKDALEAIMRKREAALASAAEEAALQAPRTRCQHLCHGAAAPTPATRSGRR